MVFTQAILKSEQFPRQREEKHLTDANAEQINLNSAKAEMNAPLFLLMVLNAKNHLTAQ